ncbi:bifunctional phosphoribosylaminoimidazolecarboxamide formyltransferase/IMP cyclohydrolase PurH [Henriciella mobilis]|uniref:bifunctional phosphoribosylaminoimidazolecarboxamide formyltransferase/IMP cyclohydrolase n=1 Tax=Henriciella mobilis TaxID=2305467 RepID=UPI000E6636D5|nr:bifunctional phosphoribosylaminoimidazolecarboxamide formyltransferase/IMP cyclohydrolase [Henriciella mobilis]RIJ18017.1 bifunctional phosphoribosylaminoimidazolecarboxamide formyltransferase/IMP cyclohydrolase PurH [Henriciella mobilis]RIJ25174.1 bifunctional phosphoribosylaminoimidazolecarboxamide formyltransferase/IMP cyclohydrolase PurH [Henriciella mobilis]
MSERFQVRRALLSVSDKTGLVEYAQRLASHGVELVSTGGSARTLKEAGLAVKDVADLTGYPEMMEGRVKTLHPAVHGGLLYLRDKESHVEDAERHGIEPIDLVYINLYPFEATVASGAGFEECIENIDIGGPAMLRAAAKNGHSVAVCTDADDLAGVLAEMDDNDATVSAEHGRRLAAKTYARTAAYDAAISGWYASQLEETAPDWIGFGGGLLQGLRYGENPHQSAAFYQTGEKRPGVANARQVQGKELSYNNINDTDAAYELIGELGEETPAVAIIKHANPCGVALGESPIEAYREALACDPTSAFGGIVALNRMLDEATAEEITKIFTEVVIAPGADEGALAVFEKKKNLRLLLANGLPDPAAKGRMVKTVAGGLLVQDRDFGRITRDELRVVTEKAPDESQMDDLLFAWRVAKHVKSNTIVYARDRATVGIGAGQMSRIDSARIAARKAEDAAEAAGWDAPRTKGCVAASDAFFPFPDGLLQAASAGATAVIQPGGSIRDDDVIAAANEAGIAMVFTGMRHFRH